MLKCRNQDARWGELIKNSEEHSYAQEQLENRNDVRSRSVPFSTQIRISELGHKADDRWRRGLHAAKRLQFGDGLTNGDKTPSTASSAFDDREYTEEEKEKILHHRRATFLGSLSMGVGKALDENAELPFQSKSLEQQHWYVHITLAGLMSRLEMIDWKHRYGRSSYVNDGYQHLLV